MKVPRTPVIPAATAEMFGKADRSDVELDALAADPLARIEVPVLRSRVLRNAQQQPTGVTTRFLWKPALLARTDMKPAFDVFITISIRVRSLDSGVHG